MATLTQFTLFFLNYTFLFIRFQLFGSSKSLLLFIVRRLKEKKATGTGWAIMQSMDQTFHWKIDTYLKKSSREDTYLKRKTGKPRHQIKKISDGFNYEPVRNLLKN